MTEEGGLNPCADKTPLSPADTQRVVEHLQGILHVKRLLCFILFQECTKPTAHDRILYGNCGTP